MSPAHVIIRMTAIFALVLLVGFSAGMLVERNLIQGGRGGESEFPDLNAVSDVIEDNYYYRPTDPDAAASYHHQMEQQAIAGMLASLNDEYTRYLPPDEALTAAENLEGEHFGVGIEPIVYGGQAIVAEIWPDSPAAEAGIARGDIIERVDGLPAAASDQNELVRLLRGPEGSTVRLTVAGPGESAGREYEMTRREIVVPPVISHMVEGSSVARIHIKIFGDRTTSELDKALDAAQAAGATGIILDLRGNGGGWVTSAQEVIGRFLSPDVGPALYEDVTPGRGDEIPLEILSNGSEFYDAPLIVVVDRWTASAAEIVAGSLRDYNRALVVGEQTFGKGSVQRIFDFSDGASMRVTVAEWFTPSKGRIQEEGIQPDIVLSMDEHAQTGEDPMIGTAVSLLESGTSRPTDLSRSSGDLAAPNPVATPAA